MKTMPKEIKNKLRQLQKAQEKVNNLMNEVESMFQEYDIDTDYLRAMGNDEFNIESQTEALSFISYAEGNVENNIKEIEKVFLYHVNKNKDNKN